MPLFITGLRSEEIKERVKNSLGGSMEEMLRVRGWNPSMEMTDDAKKKGICIKCSDIQVSTYKLEVEVESNAYLMRW
jgi:hypothetical protein